MARPVDARRWNFKGERPGASVESCPSLKEVMRKPIPGRRPYNRGDEAQDDPLLRLQRIEAYAARAKKHKPLT